MKVLSETNEALAVAHLVFCFLVFPFAIALFRLRKKGIPLQWSRQMASSKKKAELICTQYILNLTLLFSKLRAAYPRNGRGPDLLHPTHWHACCV
jgi:hypothetical protein